MNLTINCLFLSNSSSRCWAIQCDFTVKLFLSGNSWSLSEVFINISYNIELYFFFPISSHGSVLLWQVCRYLLESYLLLYCPCLLHECIYQSRCLNFSECIFIWVFAVGGYHKIFTFEQMAGTFDYFFSRATSNVFQLCWQFDW